MAVGTRAREVCRHDLWFVRRVGDSLRNGETVLRERPVTLSHSATLHVKRYVVALWRSRVQTRIETRIGRRRGIVSALKRSEAILKRCEAAV